MKKLVLGLATLSALAFGGSAGAQQAAGPRSAISINPIGLIFTVISAEFEHALAPSYSVGVSASQWSFDEGDEFSSAEVSYFSTDAKLRYYPSATALRGFALGGTAGFTRLGGSFENESGEETGSANALSLGVLVDYNWLLGANNNFFVGTGIGAKRLFVTGIAEEEGLALAYPTLRISVGYAF